MATPFKVAGLLPAWTELGLLKAQKAQLDNQREAYAQLQAKLDRVPDLSQAHVMMPKAALVQATSTQPSGSVAGGARAGQPGASEAGSNGGGDDGESDLIRISAQQAFDLTKSAQQAIHAKLAEVDAAIARAEATAKSETPEQAGLDKDWTINDEGEVVNEEGLPMFDIHEELPALPEEPKIHEIKDTPIENPPQPKTRYLIKKGGRQTFGTIKPVPAPLSSDFKMNPETQKLLDELEKEEEEEARRAAEAGSAEAGGDGAGLAKKEEGEEEAKATAVDKGKGKEVNTPAPAAVRPPAAAPVTTTSRPPAAAGEDQRAPPKKAPAGFAAGFLNKKTKAKLAGQAAKVSVPPETEPESAAPTPKPVAAPAVGAPAPAQASPPSSPRHEPLHHILPPPTPIYKPTPPPSEPASRSASPRPSRKSVAFDASVVEPVHKSPKAKRAPILLPAPPGMEGGAEPAPPPASAPAPKFERPIKEAVVEREVKAPTAPRPRDNLTSGGADKKPRTTKDKVLNTMGFAPRAEGQAPRGQIIEKSTRAPEPMPSAAQAGSSSASSAAAAAAGPIHTLSLSGAAAAKPFSEQGTLSVYEIDDEEEDEEDDGDDHDSDESSDGFYASDSDDEEVDIDAALHAREIALEYHRQRMNVGAGAGTGPLGGFADPESFDAWNQPDVPLDATLQGREPSHGNASRFRTGRLESTQMIIPSLLQGQVVASLDGDGDDGMSAEEHAALKQALDALASHEGGGRVELLEETKRRAVEAAVAREAEGRRVPEVVQARRPPVVQPAAAQAQARQAATPIAVPSNFGGPGEAPKEVGGGADPEVVAPTPPAAAAPGKKMSRFKARQLGLDV